MNEEGLRKMFQDAILPIVRESSAYMAKMLVEAHKKGFEDGYKLGTMAYAEEQKTKEQ